VQRLHRFLAANNSDAARRAVKAIREGVKVIAMHPSIGRPVPEMAPEYREWPIGFGESGYIALYRCDGNTPVILAVRHQKEAGY
jgi:plasmid stabilization system protein ParE